MTSVRRPLGALPTEALLVFGLLAACAMSTPRHAASPAGATVVPGTRPSGAAAFLGDVHLVRIGDISIGYRQAGAGPPLILIAGQYSGMNAWSVALPQRLAQHFRITMFDNRGIGYSTDDPRKPLTIQLMADDTAALLRALRINHANVLGWSTGGEIALALSVRHPDLVRTLVLSGATAGGSTAIQATPAIDALLASDRLEDEVRLLGEYLFTPSGSAAMNEYIGGYLQVPAGEIGAQIKRRQADAETAFARSNEIYDALPRIKVPTLVTNGALDQLVPPGNARIIADRIPNARLEIFPEAAHAMLFEQMDRFVTLVETFVQAGN